MESKDLHPYWNGDIQRTRLRHFDVDSKESGKKTSNRVVGSEWLTNIPIPYSKKKANKSKKDLDLYL